MIKSHKIFLLLLLPSLLLNAFEVCASVESDTEQRLELRHRLDSLEVEKQTLKRQGKPLSELETMAAQLRDTLSTLRAIPESVHQEAQASKSFPFFSSLPFSFPQWVLSFHPRSFFDWIIVATGLVALLSGFLLIIGIIHTLRAKKRNAKPKMVGRRINLAASSDRESAITAPEIPKIDPNVQPPSGFSGYDFAGRRPDQVKSRVQNKTPLADDNPIDRLRERIRNAEPSEQQTAAAPLFASAPPESPQLPKLPHQLKQQYSASGLSTQELVMAASQEGLNAQEISRRCQISIDQVNLILRMAKK
ncbi:MAG: hypothetical protein LBI42_05010 [Chitinispirillales bacterium]|jgi:hypothetical protein|nr:hypothetical protein [Chitinispirillales bacterium]